MDHDGWYALLGDLRDLDAQVELFPGWPDGPAKEGFVLELAGVLGRLLPRARHLAREVLAQAV